MRSTKRLIKREKKKKKFESLNYLVPAEQQNGQHDCDQVNGIASKGS